METVSWPDTIAPIKFAWNSDGRVQDHTSRWPRDDDKTAADDTSTTNVEHADDLMLMFQARPDLSDGFTALNTHMLRFGLEFHLARSCDTSKTVAMYVPSPSHPASKADLSPIMLPATTVGGQSQAAGRVDFAKELKCLGSIMISSDLTDTPDCWRENGSVVWTFDSVSFPSPNYKSAIDAYEQLGHRDDAWGSVLNRFISNGCSTVLLALASEMNCSYVSDNSRDGPTVV